MCLSAAWLWSWATATTNTWRASRIPLIDSKAISASLKRLGFEVVEGYDLNMEEMRATVAQYAAQLDGAKVALVYYAGHGIAVGGDNYLIPTDAVLKSSADVDFRTLNINLVLRQMQREERVNVVILEHAATIRWPRSWRAP